LFSQYRGSFGGRGKDPDEKKSDGGRLILKQGSGHQGQVEGQRKRIPALWPATGSVVRGIEFGVQRRDWRVKGNLISHFRRGGRVHKEKQLRSRPEKRQLIWH